MYFTKSVQRDKIIFFREIQICLLRSFMIGRFELSSWYINIDSLQ